MRNLLLILCFLISLKSFAQVEEGKKVIESAKKLQDTSLLGLWKPLGVVGLNASQVALSNWTQGGQSALAWTVFGNFGLIYNDNNWLFTNQFKASYGMNKLGDEKFKITDNEVFLESVIIRKFHGLIDPYFSNTVRSVISDGFDYSNSQKVQIAAFFDPGYIYQGLGAAYVNGEVFSTRLGLGLQETFASTYSNFTDDPSTLEIETFKFDTGIESVSTLKLVVDDNLLYNSSLRLFSRFKSFDVWDIRWDNILTAKVTKLINVNLNVLVVYDITQTRRTQVKEALQLGIAYSIF